MPPPVAQDMERLEDKSGTLGLLVTTVEKGRSVTVHAVITDKQSPVLVLESCVFPAC